MNLKNKFLTVILFLFCSVNTVWAIDIPDAMKDTMARETVGMPSLLNLVVSMVLVILLIYFTGWVYSKLNIVNRNKLKKMAENDLDFHRFNVIQSMPLGQQRHLYTIEMAGKILLIGSTPSHVSLIKEFDKPDIEKESIVDSLNDDINDANEQLKKSVDIDALYKKYKS